LTVAVKQDVGFDPLRLHCGYGVAAMTCVRQWEPGNAVLLTTYHSDGETIHGGQPLIETRSDAPDGAALLDEVWSSLNPAYRVAPALDRTPCHTCHSM
jgi:hypothetical protein